MTAMVPLGSAARCAAVSMPRASPETTTKPAVPRSCAKARAMRVPSDEALRAPTSAIIGRRNRAGSPSSHKSGGASEIPAR